MNSVERLRATYEMRPVDRLFRREFYIWEEAVARWRTEGMPPDADLRDIFGFDELGDAGVGGLGWCEPPFAPGLGEQVLESTDDYEIVRDCAGRTVKVFKGRRHGFMPTYLRHAVTCEADWREQIAPLLSPVTPQRWEGFEQVVAPAEAAQRQGRMIIQSCIGGYMYLRALVGPEEICYMLVDDPGLVHQMMRAWLELADAWTARVQQRVEPDVLYLAEDICYNHGLLIAPEMVREFLFPYYRQFLANMRGRQKGRHLYFQLDTDGNVEEAIDLYRAIGMDVMLPFEVAAGNDVVKIARKYPDLVISGGIDKRVLAAGPKAIDEYLEYVIPFMVKRGGYIPTCDHGVPDNVSFENYAYYRKRIMEMDH